MPELENKRNPIFDIKDESVVAQYLLDNERNPVEIVRLARQWLDLNVSAYNEAPRLVVLILNHIPTVIDKYDELSKKM